QPLGSSVAVARIDERPASGRRCDSAGEILPHRKRPESLVQEHDDRRVRVAARELVLDAAPLDLNEGHEACTRRWSLITDHRSRLEGISKSITATETHGSTQKFSNG